ncbi:MAG: LysE family translocator [Pseudomonadota bacterium]|nr:LysE family translocator [Pseudomonadota bacterium]
MFLNASGVFLTENVFLRAFVLGVLIAAPVGPVGVLCIRRTLQRGTAAGLATGIGAATADMLFAGVAAFGFSVVMAFIRQQQASLGILGGLVLLAMAWFTYRSAPAAPPDETRKPKSLFRAFSSGLMVTLTNPVTMLAIFALTTGLGQATTMAEAAVLMGGIFLGSAAWWVFLCLATGAGRHRIHPSSIPLINTIAAVVIALSGVYTLVSAGLSVAAPVLAGWQGIP